MKPSGATTFDSKQSTGAVTSAARPVRTICHVSDEGGNTKIDFGRESVSKLLAGGGFFWLDLDKPEGDDFEILRDLFGFHPLAVEDSEHFDQRAKIDDYDDLVFFVVYGASADADKLVEVHCFYSERLLVTVHRDDCPAIAELRRRCEQRREAIDRPSLLLYRLVDGLVAGFFSILGEFDNRIDELEDQIFHAASDERLQEIFAMKRVLVGMRKAVTPQRDAFAGLRGGLAQLPGFDEEDEHYFRDVYDHHRTLAGVRRRGRRDRVHRPADLARLLQATGLVLVPLDPTRVSAQTLIQEAFS